MGGQAAAVCYHGGGAGKQRRPRWGGGLGYQHVTVGEGREVLRPVDDADWTGGASGGGGMPGDRPFGGFGAAAGLLHRAVDDIADQRCRVAEGQRCGQLPLVLPDFTPLSDAGDPSADLAGKCRGDLVAGAEVDVVGLLDRLEIGQVLSEPGGAAG